MAQLTDTHCHLLPEELRPRGARSWDDLWFSNCMEGERARFASGGDVLAALDAAGLDRAVCFGWPFQDQGLLREVNDYVSLQVRQGGGRLLGLAVVNPGRPGWEAELERCAGLGLVGVGELNADAQGFELELRGGFPSLLRAVAARGWPVLLHSSEPVGHDYAGKGGATPERLWPLLLSALEECPELRLCLAHLGGGLPLYAHMPEVRRLCQRLWFDTAALPFLYDEAVLPGLQALLGPGRFCLGSDFPLLAPSRYRGLLAPAPAGLGEALAEAGARSWLGEAASAG
ncbi:MAG: amidohydrolase family protein [Candidatus Dormibacteria bacterium]